MLSAIVTNGQQVDSPYSGIQIESDTYQGMDKLGWTEHWQIESFHLHDSVKSVTTYFSKTDDLINNILTLTQSHLFEVPLKFFPYIEFNPEGGLSVMISRARVNVTTSPVDPLNLPEFSHSHASDAYPLLKTEYSYDDEDFGKKKQYHPKTNIPYGVYDGNKMRLNSYSRIGNSPPDKDQILKIKYEYELNPNGTLKSEKRFSYELRDIHRQDWKRETDSLADYLDAHEPLYKRLKRATKTYFYDDLDRLVRKEFTVDSVSTYRILDCNVGLNCWAEFHYDDKSRLSEVDVMGGPAYKFMVEKYTYNENGKLYKLARRKHNDDRWLEYEYNEFGDIINIICVSDKPSYQKYCLKNQHYVYQYDAHHNWIRCSIYFEGNTTEPLFVLERNIEYYEK